MSYSIVTTNWFRLAFPLLLVTLLWTGMSNVITVTQANIGFASHLPYIILGSVFTLGHFFKQSRISMISAALILSYWVIQVRLQSPLTTGSTLLELSLLAFLLPVASFLVYPMSDTGINSRTFGVYILVLLMFVFWAYLIVAHYNDGGFSTFSNAFLYYVPQISRLPLILVLYLAALVGISAILVLRNNRIVDVSVYSVVSLTSITFIFFHVHYVSSTMFSVAGILLLIYLLSASYELAFNDRLTGIPGRLALDADLRHLGRHFTVAMVDIDHFKSFNDTYGHDTGDDVLKLVASKLTKVGGRARVYRYGGEEFTVLFKGKNADEATSHLETLRQSIEGYEMYLRDDSRPKNDKQGLRQRGKAKKRESVNVTISIGYADSKTSRKAEEIMKRADNALYKAKEKGRNRIEKAKT